MGILGQWGDRIGVFSGWWSRIGTFWLEVM